MWGVRVTVCCLPLILVAGCSPAMKRSNAAKQIADAPLEADIIGVKTYYTNNPFMSFDPEGDPNPEGLKITYYAVSGDTGRGAFADGVIRFKMYVIDRSGKQPRGMLVKTWEFTPQEAKGWRVTRRSVMGWGYLFYLNWEDADVYGKEIRIVPECERPDGKVVRGTSRNFKVPAEKQGIILEED